MKMIVLFHQLRRARALRRHDMDHRTDF